MGARLVAGQLVDYLGVGMMRTMMPFYAQKLGAASGSGGTLLGGLESAYGVGQMAGAAVLGRLSDIHGRRAVLMLSFFGSTLGCESVSTEPVCGCHNAADTLPVSPPAACRFNGGLRGNARHAAGVPSARRYRQADGHGRPRGGGRLHASRAGAFVRNVSLSRSVRSGIRAGAAAGELVPFSTLYPQLPFDFLRVFFAVVFSLTT